MKAVSVLIRVERVVGAWLQLVMVLRWHKHRVKKNVLGALAAERMAQRTKLKCALHLRRNVLQGRAFAAWQASHFQACSQPVLPFSKLNKIFFGYFDPKNIFLDNKNK